MIVSASMMKRTPSGKILTELILEAFRLNGALLNAGNRITKPLGLTSARWQVMGAIELAGQPLTVAQVARRMGLARQGVQRIINDLERLEMLELKSNIDHKRSPLVSISAKGKRVMAEVNKAQIAWVNKLAEGLGIRKVEQALKLIQSVSDRLEQQK